MQQRKSNIFIHDFNFVIDLAQVKDESARILSISIPLSSSHQRKFYGFNNTVGEGEINLDGKVVNLSLADYIDNDFISDCIAAKKLSFKDKVTGFTIDLDVLVWKKYLINFGKFRDEIAESLFTLANLMNEIKDIKLKLQNIIEKVSLYLKNSNINHIDVELIPDIHRRLNEIQEEISKHINLIKIKLDQKTDIKDIWSKNLDHVELTLNELTKSCDLLLDHFTHEGITKSKKLLLSHTNHSEAWNIVFEQLNTQAIFSLQRIIYYLSQANLLTNNNVENVYRYAIKNKLNQLESHFHDMCDDKNDFNLLTQDYINAIFQEEQIIDKSCRARLDGGRGLNAVRGIEKQKRWAGYCLNVESKILDMFKAKSSLTDIFDYARMVRRKIADKENVISSYQFGELRMFPSIDIYSAVKDETIVSGTIFDSIASVIKDEVTIGTSDNLFNTNFFKKSIEINTVCQLPIETLEMTSKDKSVIKVTTIFSSMRQSEIYDSLNKIDKHFLQPIYNHDDQNQDEFLTMLGQFVFHMVRLYPLTRGTAGTIQWMIRSLMKEHLELNMGDINLGEKKDIPYDVYAQLVSNPDNYAAVFKNSLIGLVHSPISTAPNRI